MRDGNETSRKEFQYSSKGNVVYYEENKDSVTLGEYNMIRTPLGESIP